MASPLQINKKVSYIIIVVQNVCFLSIGRIQLLIGHWLKYTIPGVMWGISRSKKRVERCWSKAGGSLRFKVATSDKTYFTSQGNPLLTVTFCTRSSRHAFILCFMHRFLLCMWCLNDAIDDVSGVFPRIVIQLHKIAALSSRSITQFKSFPLSFEQFFCYFTHSARFQISLVSQKYQICNLKSKLWNPWVRGIDFVLIE